MLRKWRRSTGWLPRTVDYSSASKTMASRLRGLSEDRKSTYQRFTLSVLPLSIPCPGSNSGQGGRRTSTTDSKSLNCRCGRCSSGGSQLFRYLIADSPSTAVYIDCCSGPKLSKTILGGPVMVRWISLDARQILLRFRYGGHERSQAVLPIS